MRRSISAIALLVLFVGVVHPSFAKPSDPAHEITSQLICPCSCGEVVSGCICETGMSMKATVENGIKAGKSKKEIVGALVSQYGEVIRGAPKAEGFNLIVWIAPFAATLFGYALAFWILRRWVRRRGAFADVDVEGLPADGR
ncbi:MAG TPA: cytochrome c-type biogenesis protein, partial [Candidatus Eisenbacteria bacterium]|nr:cytochrome c-type biogenesis protein [Candidatus Eisenbacteria bacterium]